MKKENKTILCANCGAEQNIKVQVCFPFDIIESKECSNCQHLINEEPPIERLRRCLDIAQDISTMQSSVFFAKKQLKRLESDSFICDVHTAADAPVIWIKSEFIAEALKMQIDFLEQEINKLHLQLNELKKT
jgi:hypothetical protein